MRRPIKKRPIVDPDSVYSSALVARIINSVMKDGKKSIAQRTVYAALNDLEKRAEKPALEALELAVQNVAPNVQLKSRRVGGANYQVPVEVGPARRLALAIRWIVGSARSQKGKPMNVKLADELFAAFQNTGSAVKKRADMHRMAEANKAFAHLAW
ncbi:MAG: 30S ribosomal protein S7 [Candidatus Paceibacterota bacterium]|nr:MAG: 30S ribosomal protein S7 [Candidatus Paceibacterota bacterium]